MDSYQLVKEMATTSCFSDVSQKTNVSANQGYENAIRENEDAANYAHPQEVVKF